MNADAAGAPAVPVTCIEATTTAMRDAATTIMEEAPATTRARATATMAAARALGSVLEAAVGNNPHDQAALWSGLFV